MRQIPVQRYEGQVPQPFAVYRPANVHGFAGTAQSLGIAHISGVAVLEQEKDELLAEEATILKDAEKGNVDPFRSRLDEINDRITAIDEDKARLARAEARQRQAPKAKDGEEHEPGTIGALNAATRSVDARSPGEQFIESDEWKEFVARVAPNGFSDKKQFGQGPAVKIPNLMRGRQGATLVTGDSSTSAGAFVVNDVYPGLFAQGLQRPLTIRDIVTNGRTNSDTVEFVQMTSQTNAAAPTAEATATSGTSGTKPESAIALAKVTTVVKTIAHWIPATKRALADAGQLRTLIDAFLRYGLEEELEDQMMTGDGVGENFTGIANTSGIQAQAWDTNILTTTRKARTKVRTVGRSVPTAYIFNPTDWETIDLLQDNEARFYGAGPFGLSPARLWGLPVVESEGQTAGQGHVGDFRKCVLWDREQASVSASDSHSDFFIRNMVAILAELRAAFGIVQPNAIVEIDLTAV